MANSVEILAIGAHPDDVELSCAGTLLRSIDQGKKVCIADLSRGELGTRGNGELRTEESEKAAEILGISDRMNLDMRDGFFTIDEDHIKEVVRLIRHLRPRIILANALEDRHPDHGRAAELVRQACFYAGLRKIKTDWDGVAQEVHRPDSLHHYIQFKYLRPDFLVDITDYKEKKMESVMAYGSQFYDPDSREPETMISSQGFLDFLDARMLEFGRIIGTKYAEGFNTSRLPRLDDLDHLK